MSAMIVKPKFLRRIGFILFALSFVTPNWEFEGIGIASFIVVPELVWHSLTDGGAFYDWQGDLFTISLSLAWLSNFTVFFSLPRPAAIIAMTSPWILFFEMMFLTTTGAPNFRMLEAVSFYPWAVGIGLIHWSRWMEQRNSDSGSSPVAHS